MLLVIWILKQYISLFLYKFYLTIELIDLIIPMWTPYAKDWKEAKDSMIPPYYNLMELIAFMLLLATLFP